MILIKNKIKYYYTVINVTGLRAKGDYSVNTLYRRQRVGSKFVHTKLINRVIAGFKYIRIAGVIYKKYKQGECQ